jgi:hypothetical protein
VLLLFNEENQQTTSKNDDKKDYDADIETNTNGILF